MSSQIKANRIEGKLGEKGYEKSIRGSDRLYEQVRIQPYDKDGNPMLKENGKPLIVIVDYVRETRNGKLKLREIKTGKGGLTKNQDKGFPNIQAYGGCIKKRRGDQDRLPDEIGPTKVKVIYDPHKKMVAGKANRIEGKAGEGGLTKDQRGSKRSTDKSQQDNSAGPCPEAPTKKIQDPNVSKRKRTRASEGETRKMANDVLQRFAQASEGVRRTNDSRLFISAGSKLAAIRDGFKTATANCAQSVAANKLQEIALGTGNMQSGLAGVAARAVGAYVSGEGIAQTVKGMGKAAVEARTVEAAGKALLTITQGSAPTLTGFINEANRKGLEFAGGHMLSVGVREKSGHEKLKDGTAATMHQRESGVQFRRGILQGIAGVGGNLGVTHRSLQEEKPDGTRMVRSEELTGFAGGVDILGMEVRNLDTGLAHITEETSKEEWLSSTKTKSTSTEFSLGGLRSGQIMSTFSISKESLLCKSKVDVDIKTGMAKEESEGLLLKSTTHGSVAGDVASHGDTPVFSDTAEVVTRVRDEVKAAAKDGAEVGSMQSRRVNEATLKLSATATKEGIKDGVKLVGTHMVGGVAGLITGEVLGRACRSPCSGATLGKAVGASLAAAATTDGDAQAKLQSAFHAGRDMITVSTTNVAMDKFTEKALGAGSLQGGAARVAARAVGAASGSGDRWQRLTAAGKASAQACVVEASGMALRKCAGAVAPIPTGVINESDRKGLEFAGGHMLSVGKRQRSGKETRADGTCSSIHQQESGVQVRVGACAGILGFNSILGKMQSEESQESPGGGQVVTSKNLRGFAGGIDMFGCDICKLDSGIQTVKRRTVSHVQENRHVQRHVKVKRRNGVVKEKVLTRNVIKSRRHRERLATCKAWKVLGFCARKGNDVVKDFAVRRNSTLRQRTRERYQGQVAQRRRIHIYFCTEHRTNEATGHEQVVKWSVGRSFN